VWSGLQRAINRRLCYWPPPDDEDYRHLTARLSDVDVDGKGLLEFYARWLPDATGVAEASVRLQERETSYTEGRVVWLNVRDSLDFKTARERLAWVHVTMWHEAAHVRHPIPGPWLDELAQREPDVGRQRLDDAFQLLEDLRVERELVSAKPQAAPWLRYAIGCHGGVFELAVGCGKDPDCGWARAATMTAGRAIAGVIDHDTLHRITRFDKRLADQTTRFWDVWETYSRLTDAECDAGFGDDQLLALARALPEAILLPDET
jgi:hypothetical protein